jgi:hypothetical protein
VRAIDRHGDDADAAVPEVDEVLGGGSLIGPANLGGAGPVDARIRQYIR